VVFRPQRAAATRSVNLRAAAGPLHIISDTPAGPMPTQPPIVSTCLEVL